MTDILILYIDSDFIYPVVTDGHGACEKYEHPDRRYRDWRIWLYFEQDMLRGSLTPLRRARDEYRAGNPAFAGDVFGLLSSSDKTKISRAQELLDRGGVLAELKALYSNSGERSEVNIPTVYVFAGNIPETARRTFIEFMEGHSFATISYSVSLESMAANILFQGADFGDMLLTYAGSGNDLVATSFICESQQFLQAAPAKVFKDSGYNPVREALVHYVVNKIESKYHFLVGEDTLKAEIEYQKQNVDAWLADINLNDSVSTIAYKYKNFDSEYQVQVETEMLKSELNRYVERQLQEMNSYRNRATATLDRQDAPVRDVLLIGDTFADEDFRSRVASSVGRGAQVKYLPVSNFDSVLCLYPELYPELKETLREFERVARKTGDRISDTTKFIEVAGSLSTLADDATSLAADFEALASALKRKMDSALAQVEEMLAASNFNAAEEALRKADIPTVDSPLFRREAALQSAIARNQSNLKNENAKGIALRIALSLEQIALYDKAVKEQLSRAADLESEIERLRLAWPEYQRLMQEFEHADVTRKRAIVDEIASRRLTRAPLPLTGLRAPFLAEIQAEVVTTGKFLGLFGGKKTLKGAVLMAPGYKSECKTVLLVQDSPFITIIPSNIRKTIEADTQGRVEFEIPLPLDGKTSARRLYINLKPAPDQAISPNDNNMAVTGVTVEI